MTLTIYACPKAFTGHFATIQWNAIRSWTLLEPKPRIVLLGSDSGVGEAARELGVEQVESLPRSEFGTPLVPGIFQHIRELTAGGTAAYVNADIMLLPEFTAAVSRLSALRSFLMIGRRWNLDIDERLDFGSGWADALRAEVAARGELYGPRGIDYFVFPPRLFGTIPPFALGRTWWDNWVLIEAVRRGAKLVDATADVTVVHQNHDYPAEWNIAKDRNWWLKGAESEINRSLGGYPRWRPAFGTAQADLRLEGGTLVPSRVGLIGRLDRFVRTRPALWSGRQEIERFFTRAGKRLRRRLS